MRNRSVGRIASCASCAFLVLVLYCARLLGQVVLAEALADQPPAGAQRLARELDAVGAHVGDQADGLAADVDALEQALRGLHRAVGREAELARGLLLQGRGAEGRRRVAADLLLLDRVDREASRASISRTARRGRGLVAQGELVEPLAVELGQPRLEGCGPRASPAAPRRSSIPAALKAWISASRSQIRRSATDCTRPAERARFGQLAPQHRREAEADEIVERAARLVGVDQMLVEAAAVAHGLEHGGLGDLVEHHALDVDALERARSFSSSSRCQEIASPSRSGSVARIRRLAPSLTALRDLVDALLPVVERLVDDLEILVGQDRAVLLRQVADVAVARQDLVARRPDTC